MPGLALIVVPISIPLRMSTSKTWCWFDKNPGGCKKKNCKFLHSGDERVRGRDAVRARHDSSNYQSVAGSNYYPSGPEYGQCDNNYDDCLEEEPLYEDSPSHHGDQQQDHQYNDYGHHQYQRGQDSDYQGYSPNRSPTYNRSVRSRVVSSLSI